MLTYTGTATVSFSVPAAGVEFTPAENLVLAPAPGQRLGRLALVVFDDDYDFSAALWSSDDPLLSFSGAGPATDVLIDASTLDGECDEYPVTYRVDY